ncbi:MAG: MalY/PatB family protein [Woeseiaceae bacterium]
MDLDKTTNRLGTDSYKWDGNETVFGRPDLLPFWVADMDFETPQPVLDAIRERCRHPVLGYGIRSDAYYDAITQWVGQRHHWSVPREWLMFCPPSAIVGIHGIITATTGESASIVVHTPTYGPLMALVRDTGRQLIECPLQERHGHFVIDPESLGAACRPDTQMIILCNPHNPTGRVFSPEELETIAEIAREKDLLVVSDEVHCDLVLPGSRHIPFGMIGGERSVTVISPNKTFNTAGVPQSTLIIPSTKIRQRFAAYLDTMQLNHDSTFGAVAMIAGYTQCKAWLEEVISYVNENHEFVARWLKANLPVVRKTKAQATYLAWLDFRRTGLEEAAIQDRLVQIGGIGLYPGSIFGAAGAGFFRMNLACPRTRLEQGLDRIRLALSGL